MSYQELLDKIAECYGDILKDNLVGIYVHGSIAMKCFNWNKSDVDFIVVVNEKLSQDIKLKLMEAIIALNAYAPPKGLEMSIVLKKHCEDFKYPTPFELHFSNMHIDWYKGNAGYYCENMQGEDKDLAAHFTIIKKFGIVWLGQSIEEVFGTIPKYNYLDSIKGDVEDAKDDISDNPIYIILNLCRVLAYAKGELILSKEQGGSWGLQNLEQKYHNIVSKAVQCYQTDEVMVVDKEEAENYCEYIMKAILDV
jgi:predicted nucleotidyltransferase